MFPRALISRIAADLLDVADAMLCPVDELAARSEAASAEHAHPHRTPARVPRRRRAGETPPRAHDCLSPLPERSRRAVPAARS